MNVLIACEYSGAVRDAFTALGHFAVSCDLLPSDKPGRHYTGSVLDIAHPPCTYICSSGLHWNKRRPERAALTADAVEFARIFIDGAATRHIPHRAVENPIGCLSSIVRKPEQIIQPHQYGHDASKATCLWLHNLPTLQATKHIAPRMVNGRERWGNQTDSGQNALPPSDDRWKIRSETYAGIAHAMAWQWGGLFLPSDNTLFERLLALQ